MLSHERWAVNVGREHWAVNVEPMMFLPLRGDDVYYPQEAANGVLQTDFVVRFIFTQVQLGLL